MWIQEIPWIFFLNWVKMKVYLSLLLPSGWCSESNCLANFHAKTCFPLNLIKFVNIFKELVFILVVWYSKFPSNSFWSVSMQGNEWNQDNTSVMKGLFCTPWIRCLVSRCLWHGKNSKGCMIAWLPRNIFFYYFCVSFFTRSKVVFLGRVT